MRDDGRHSIRSLVLPPPHPVRKVAHLLCDDAPVPARPSPPSPPSGGKRPRGAQSWPRGPRGRFIERSGPPPAPTATTPRSGPMKVVKRPYKKYYSNPTPSSHCHVCARTAKAVRFATCARIAQGFCRKVTCDKCFSKFGWNWEAAINDPNWICVHCRGECPEGRSQCFIYARVNRRRETKRGTRSAGSRVTPAPTSPSTTSGRPVVAERKEITLNRPSAPRVRSAILPTEVHGTQSPTIQRPVESSSRRSTSYAYHGQHRLPGVRQLPVQVYIPQSSSAGQQWTQRGQQHMNQSAANAIQARSGAVCCVGRVCTDVR